MRLLLRWSIFAWNLYCVLTERAEENSSQSLFHRKSGLSQGVLGRNEISIVDGQAQTRHVARPPGDGKLASEEIHDPEVDETDNSALDAQGLSKQQHNSANVPSMSDGHRKTRLEELSTGKEATQSGDNALDDTESSAQSPDGPESDQHDSLQVVYSGKPEHLAAASANQTDWMMTSQFTCESCKAVFDYEYILKGIILQKHRHIHILLIVVLITWAVVLIWLLTSTAQSFFVPPLIYWASRFQMRPELAGATLLALGNGAPDVFAAGSAAQAEDLPLALSELIGANVFVLCITCGCVILVSKDSEPHDSSHHIHVERFQEAIAGYSLALLAIGYILYDGRVSIYEAGTMPLLYCLYVAMVYVRGANSEEAGPDWYRDRNPDAPVPEERDLQFPHSLPDAPSAKTNDDARDIKASTVPPEYHPLEGLHCPEDASYLETLGFLVAWPTYLLRWLSIPPSDGYWDRTRRLICAFCPTGLSMFFLSTGLIFDDFPGVSCLSAVFSMSMLIGMFIYFVTDDGPQLPSFYPLITMIAKITSILWLGVISAELTAVVESCGRAFRLESITLGFTVIGWGNGAGDLLTCMAMAQRNQSRAAFAAVLAGPLFDDLVGFGLALLLAAYSRGGEIILWEAAWPKDIRPPMFAGVAMLLASLSIMCAMVVFDAKLSSRRWAWALFACYGVFFLSVVASTSTK